MDIDSSRELSKSSIFKMLYTLEAKGFVGKGIMMLISTRDEILKSGFNI